MKTRFKSISLCSVLFTLAAMGVNAQSYNWISSCEGNVWQQEKVSLQNKPSGKVDMTVDDKKRLSLLRHGGRPLMNWIGMHSVC